MSSYTVKRPLVKSDLKFINNLPDGSTIEFRNTVGLNKDIIKEIKPSIKIRIIGGLDEKEKPKFKTEKYYKWTIYSPLEVYKIIEKMESIESGIDSSWNDLERAMYIYKNLCEGMKYDHIDAPVEGRDINRGLLGLITGHAVCVGFAMIYKEMLDRQGIECLYQNKKYHHAWNLVKINGRLIPVDLTWDNTENEDENNRCDFKYFGRDKNFFHDENHKVTDEPVYKTSILTEKEFNDAYSNVVASKNIKAKAKKYNTKYGIQIEYLVVKEGKFKRCFISDGKTMKTVIFDDTINLKNILNYNLFTYNKYKFMFTKNESAKQEMHDKNDKIKLFTRADGSCFLVKSIRRSTRGTIEQQYIDFEKKHLYGYTIFSEDDLTKISKEHEFGVANYLLSKARVKEKATKFNGYIGFIELTNGRFKKYVNVETEEQIAGVKRY